MCRSRAITATGCFAQKVLVPGFLCATSVFSVSLWCRFTRNSSTTETQRTQRLHREERNRHFCAKPARTASAPTASATRYEISHILQRRKQWYSMPERSSLNTYLYAPIVIVTIDGVVALLLYVTQNRSASFITILNTVPSGRWSNMPSPTTVL